MMLATGFIGVFFGVLLYGIVHSSLASFTAKKMAESWFHQAGRRFYRLFFNLVAVVTFLLLLGSILWLPDRQIYKISFPWVLLTLLIQGAAVFGLLYGLHQTGLMNFLGLEQVLAPSSLDRPRRMTTSGLYAWVRHPLYTCGLLILWLTPVMSWNILAFNLGATIYITIGAAVFEERKLRQEFGEVYTKYQKRTPMLVPGFMKKK